MTARNLTHLLPFHTWDFVALKITWHRGGKRPIGPNLDIFTQGCTHFSCLWFRHLSLCVELFWWDNKFTLLHKLCTDHFTIKSKCHSFSVVPWKDIIKYFQKCEGCSHFCEIHTVHTSITSLKAQHIYTQQPLKVLGTCKLTKKPASIMSLKHIIKL